MDSDGFDPWNRGTKHVGNVDKPTSAPRKVWFDGRAVPTERRDVWEYVKHSAIDTVVTTIQQAQELDFPLRTHRVVEVDHVDAIDHIPVEATVLSQDEHVLRAAQAKGHPTCLALSIDNQHQLDQAWQSGMRYDYLVVDFDLPTNIPLELLIARLQHSETALLKREATYEAMKVAFGVLERGSDGVMLATDNLDEIAQASHYLAQASRKRIELETLVVQEVRHIGMGVRGCIDTCDLMTQDEGMIVGSTSSGGIFVCSETHYLPYMNLRPFRVNAGAVHSYVWKDADTTEYITELKAGSKVLCVDTQGGSREIVVGRVKIEVRPLLLIKGATAQSEINVIVQDDWHIRIMGADGKPKNATAIRPGDELLAYTDRPGRHVGLRVEETVIEQ